MISVTGLTKQYGSSTAVENVTFVCPAGTVTGFLGPNGAGKSTTLRILTGLTPPTAGDASIGGHRYREIPNPATQIGVVLDASAQHAGRTGREVLRLGALAMGLPRRRVDEVLRIVGLKPKESRRRIRNYSLGMRQRLGIAHALLGDPRVLILDEPANGLDPAGMRWLRNLVSDFARRGGTVLISTHLLAEIEGLADRLVIIGDGRILASGAKEELLRGTSLEDFYLGLTAGSQRDVDEEEAVYEFAVSTAGFSAARPVVEEAVSEDAASVTAQPAAKESVYEDAASIAAPPTAEGKPVYECSASITEFSFGAPADRRAPNRNRAPRPFRAGLR